MSNKNILKFIGLISALIQGALMMHFDGDDQISNLLSYSVWGVLVFLVVAWIKEDSRLIGYKAGVATYILSAIFTPGIFIYTFMSRGFKKGLIQNLWIIGYLFLLVLCLFIGVIAVDAIST